MANSNLDEQHVETVSSVCDIDKVAARELLLTHNGDLEKAVNAGLARHDTDSDSIPPLETPVIDLAGQNHDLVRAVQLSMESSQDNRLVPTDRAPHPAWQLVRANVRLCLLPFYTSSSVDPSESSFSRRRSQTGYTCQS